MTRTARLRHVAEVNPRTPQFDQLPEDAPVTFLPLEAVWPGSSLDTSRIRLKGEVTSGYTRFCTGDILVPKITPTFQANRTILATGLLGGVGAGTTELHVVRPGPTVEPRYLLYALSSQPFLQEGEASMTGVAGQKRVPDENLRGLAVLLRPIDEQRSVADYLDAETARIDTLVHSRERMLSLLGERIEGVIEESVASASQRAGTIPLRRLAADVIVGVVVRPATFYADSGWPFLRGQNLSAGSVTDADLRFISDADNRAHGKSILRDGDVLVSRVGLTGQAAVVPSWAVGGNCVGMLIIRTGRDLDPRFVELVINSRTSQQRLQALSGGSVQDVLNASALGRLPVPNLSAREQRALIGDLDRARADHESMHFSLSSQVGLMIERRQALITAAVTGQLEIPGSQREA